MKNYIVIDGGTTNTRIGLARDKKISDIISVNVGARKGIDDKNILKNEIKNAISEILKNNNLTTGDIEVVLAAGIITSEFGLYNLPHITAPSGVEDLSRGIKRVQIPEITDIPFVFIPGVKTVCKDLASADMMRGEECEVMGIMAEGECADVYILPGSHSKIIKMKNGKITEFKTMLTGEMIYSLSQYTILKDAVDLTVSEYDSEYLLKGYRYVDDAGLNEALFKARILKNIFKADSKEIYSFFLGAVLFGEIRNILNLSAKRIVIGGKGQLRNAMKEIIESVSDIEVITVPEEMVKISSFMGMISVYQGVE